MRRHDIVGADIIQQIQQLVCQIVLADRTISPRAALKRAAEVTQLIFSENDMIAALHEAGLVMSISERPSLADLLKPYQPMEFAK